jgi:hypothetical protein
VAWRERHKAAWFPCAATLAALGLFAPVPEPAGARNQGAHAPRDLAATAPPPKLVQVAHTGFWDCAPRTTKVMVAVHTLTVRPGSPLTLSFVVRNTGSHSCNYIAPAGGTVPGPATTSHLDAGPCGSLNFVVDDDNDHNVWPGPYVFNCPALGFAPLRPGASLSGTGTWDGTKPGVNAALPSGRYTLVVDGHFRFPLRLLAAQRPSS